MHNTRIRTSGAWSFASVFDPAEIEAFDAAQFASINGDDGGVWAPSSVIEIGGSGFRFTSQLEIEATYGTLLCNGTAQFNDDVEFTAGAEFNGILNNGSYLGGAATFNGDVILSGSYGLQVGGSVLLPSGNLVLTAGDIALTAGSISLGANLVVAGAAAIAGAAEVGTNLDVLGQLDVTGTSFFGDVTAAGTSTFNGDMEVKNPLILSGDGRIRKRPAAIGGDANATYNVNTYDVVYVPTSTLSTDRVYTIANATDGDCMRIYRADTSVHDISVRRADTTEIAQLNIAGTTKQKWIDIMHIAGKWEMVGRDLGL